MRVTKSIPASSEEAQGLHLLRCRPNGAEAGEHAGKILRARPGNDDLRISGDGPSRAQARCVAAQRVFQSGLREIQNSLRYRQRRARFGAVQRRGAHGGVSTLQQPAG